MIFDVKGQQLARGDTVWFADFGRLKEAYVSAIRKDGPWYKLGLILTDGTKLTQESTVGEFDEVIKL